MKILTLLKVNYTANKSVLWWLSILLFMVLVIIFILNKNVVLVNIYTMFVLVSTFIQTDNKFKTNILFCSLPVKRSTLVFTRYLSTLMALVLLLFLSFLTGLFVKIIEPTRFVTSYSFVTLGDMYWIAIPTAFIISIWFPYYFKYGYTKGSLWAFASLLLIIAVVIGCFYLFLIIKGEALVLTHFVVQMKLPHVLAVILAIIFQTIKSIGIKQSMVFLGVFTVILLVLSIRLSIKEYKKRNFY
jgi:hypothetical protein